MLTRERVELLLDAMIKHHKPCVIDWVNRSIRILSDVKTDETKIMSDGKPMQYRDILHSVKFF